MTAKKRTTNKTITSKNMAASIRSLAAGSARTVIYCHGIGNKPPESKLRSDWDRALFGFDQGERTRMAYWVDRERYPKPEGVGTRALSVENELGPAPSADLVVRSVKGSDNPKKSAALVAALEKSMRMAAQQSAQVAAKSGSPRVKAIGTKGIFSPVVDAITKVFLADVNDFLFNKVKRDRMVKTVKDRMTTGGDPFVVIGHSQGTMVTYQALMELKNTVQVDLFVTLGSPLGLPPVTEELKKWHGSKLPIPSCVKRWVNVARDGDIVCADQELLDDYCTAGKSVVDFRIADFDWMPAAHNIGTYLAYDETKKAVVASVDRARFQQISSVTIARGLASTLDDDAFGRVPVLIELVDRKPGAKVGGSASHLADARSSVLEWINTNIGSTTTIHDEIQLEDSLDRYVAARLTRSEAEMLAGSLGWFFGGKSPAVYRMFSNSRKRALIRSSVSTIQARTARLGFKADGHDITWAILDTGIDGKHRHFHNGDFVTDGNILDSWDCTKRGSVRAGGDSDVNGHGTHVAGIIAGGLKIHEKGEEIEMYSAAPRASLVSYKVLDDDGSGNDAWIIKAIDHVWAQNEQARGLVVHGVNLSLGGPFDATSFGCGDSPLCASLLRLVRQGVIVVLAAGNEGYGEIVVDGYASNLSLDLSIGDPANLEEAVAVGSVHPTLPHRYGTSFFSSRGPTADGRLKPDVVAPGEKILSCRSGGQGKTLDDLYIELSGTSMAAPHVSGLLAAFLSARTEFIGYPDRVKEILLANCTDLKRDRYHQGAGLPNLSKMLLNT